MNHCCCEVQCGEEASEDSSIFRNLSALVEALENLGIATPSGRCFCHDSEEALAGHWIVCRQARAALAQVKGEK